jgi:hypothetical protein
MVAVLAWSHTRGGRAAWAMAAPTACVEAIRDWVISARFFGP